MKLIESNVTIMNRLGNPFSIIESVGRTCYKSDSAYTKETAFKFFKQLVDSKHFAMLEHATFIFEVATEDVSRYVGKPFINVTTIYTTDGFERNLVSGNLRAIKENNLTPLMQELIKNYNFPELNYYFRLDGREYIYTYPVELLLPTEENLKTLYPVERENHLYTTFRFICDRGVSHEMVRHRPASFAQESTRYCNYSKEKFGKEITCVKPAFYDSEWTDYQKSIYENAMRQAEASYFMLIDSGLPAQKARGVLPTDLKTEVIMTANDREWKHFFDLRAVGTTGAPHPNMKKVAMMAWNIYAEDMKAIYGEEYK